MIEQGISGEINFQRQKWFCFGNKQQVVQYREGLLSNSNARFVSFLESKRPSGIVSESFLAKLLLSQHLFSNLISITFIKDIRI